MISVAAEHAVISCRWNVTSLGLLLASSCSVTNLADTCVPACPLVVAVAPHVDAPTPPAEVVATLALGGGRRDSVRVGSAQIDLEPGDVYAISGPARWDVTHEVFASMRDRLSLTLRFSPRADL